MVEIGNKQTGERIRLYFAPAGFVIRRNGALIYDAVDYKSTASLPCTALVPAGGGLQIRHQQW